VSLTVTDDDGVASDSISSDVTVVEPPNTAPTALFTSLCDNLDCDFTDTSTDGDGIVVSWDWDFGDGSTSTVQSPSHSYAAGGTYTVSLTVTDDDGESGTTMTDVVATDPVGGGPFLESDGLVVMEAENYHATVERSGDSWLESIDPTGFSGDAAMASGPDDGTRVRTDVANIAPEMSFDVEFTTTGTYYIWLRAWAPDIRGKAMFAGLDGVIANDGIAAGGSGSWGDGVGEWTWSNTGKRATPVFVDVTTPGVHTIQVWMGDDGVIVDKVILSTDPLFVPVDLGPPESEQGSAPVAEIAYRMI
jgi:PKD repeat protein